MGTAVARTESRRPAPAEQRPAHRLDLTEVDRNPHAVERHVRNVLIAHPGISISSLVVRRTREGVCLTGVVESMAGDTDVCGLVREAAGVDEVLNRLIVRSGAGE